MDRRTMLRCLGAAALSPALNAAAGITCTPFYGGQTCNVGVDSAIADIVASDTQHQSQWCWAACIETVFRYWGHPVRQERIVSDAWGGVVNLPGTPVQIMGSLNRRWIDDNNRIFTVTSDVYSANAATAIQDLTAGMPLIVGSMGHAMVLTAMTYVQTMYGWNVNAAIVRDPWPGRGRRVLTPQEWYAMNFASRIRIA